MTRIASASRCSGPFHEAHLPLLRRFGHHQTTLRFLNLSDAARLGAFFSSHTPDTIHGRYGMFVRLSLEQILRLVGVDQSRDCALGVSEGHPEELIAVGRYCLSPDHRSAEVAFVVSENRRRLGIATTLLEVLIGIACERGLTTLTAHEYTNHAMREVLHYAGAGPKVGPLADDPEVTLELEILPRAAPPAAIFQEH